MEKPIFDYLELLYEALLSPDFCNPLNHVYVHFRSVLVHPYTVTELIKNTLINYLEPNPIR
jgi:hypothetical protein